MLDAYAREARTEVSDEPWVFGGWVSAQGGWLVYNATARIATELGRAHVVSSRDRLLLLQTSLDEYRAALSSVDELGPTCSTSGGQPRGRSKRDTSGATCLVCNETRCRVHRRKEARIPPVRSPSVSGSNPYEACANPYPSIGPDTHVNSYTHVLPRCSLTSNCSPSTSNARTRRRYNQRQSLASVAVLRAARAGA